jgi:hypothetical protein
LILGVGRTEIASFTIEHYLSPRCAVNVHPTVSPLKPLP